MGVTGKWNIWTVTIRRAKDPRRDSPHPVRGYAVVGTIAMGIKKLPTMQTGIIIFTINM